jgi:glycosyltransferase involved in cell wall biosynthesis
MRVLVVTNMYPSPVSTFRGVFVERQVQSLRDAGLEVEVETITVQRGRRDYLLGRARVGRRVHEFRPDVVHVHYGYTGLAGLGHGRPSVLTLHGSDLRRGTGTRWRGRIGARLTTLLARGADSIIVQNKMMRRALPDRLAARTIVMPNGIDESMFRPLPSAEARARLDLPRDELIVMFVDAGDPRRKRPDLAAAALDCVVRRGRPARMLRASGVPAGEMPWYYAAADALLMTSDYEGSPMCVKEALACGTPVVSVPVGDVPDVVDRPELGAIAPRDPAMLAEALLAVAAQPRAGASLLPARLTSAAIAARLMAIYGQVQASARRAN